MAITRSQPFDQTLDILKELIRIDSVNPTLVPGGAGEKRIAEFLASYLLKRRVEAELQRVCTDRLNVVATVRGTEPGPRILLNGHLDTVSVEGMNRPFEPVEQGGKVFGRGSQDMKGGLAAGIAALLALAENRHRFRGEVVLAAVADEEDQSLGTQYFLSQWPKDSLFQFALVLEPTDLKLCTAHKGFAWVELTTRGVAAHGSRPQEGVDAIRFMGEILQELDSLDKQIQSGPRHPLLGTGSLHASTIQGGREWSSYPDRCLLRYERRTLPGESADTVEQEMRMILGKLGGGKTKFRAEGRLVCSRVPFEIDREHPALRQFHEAARSQMPDLVDWGAVSFWTDAALLSQAQIPTLVFGPRGAGLHSIEEYVVASDVIDCARTIYEFILQSRL
jgi:acetylornithine deacetylase/succinyl-diaminopimelate desuccinylase family protein